MTLAAAAWLAGILTAIAVSGVVALHQWRHANDQRPRRVRFRDFFSDFEETQ